jgi:hypothetical protein
MKHKVIKLVVFFIFYYTQNVFSEIKNNYTNNFFFIFNKNCFYQNSYCMVDLRSRVDAYREALRFSDSNYSEKYIDLSKNEKKLYNFRYILSVGNVLCFESFNLCPEILEKAIKKSNGAPRDILLGILNEKRALKFEFRVLDWAESSLFIIQDKMKFPNEGKLVRDIRECKKRLNAYVENNLAEVAYDFCDIKKVKSSTGNFVHLMDRALIKTCVNNPKGNKIDVRAILKENYYEKPFDEKVFFSFSFPRGDKDLIPGLSSGGVYVDNSNCNKL